MISGWRPSDPINFLPPPEGGGNSRYEDTLSRHISTLNLHLEPADNLRLASLCGPFDDILKQLERRLGSEFSYRGNHFQVNRKRIARFGIVAVRFGKCLGLRSGAGERKNCE